MLLLLTVLAVGAATFAAALVLQTSAGGMRRTVQARILGGDTAGDSHQAALALAIPRIETLSARTQRLAAELEQAGLSLKVSEYAVLRTVFAVLLGVAVMSLAGSLGFSQAMQMLLAMTGFFAGFYLPAKYVDARRARRLAQMEDQLVEVFTSIVKSLRSGLSFMQSLDYAVRETPSPLGPELQRVVRDLQLGSDPETRFEELNRRLGSPDFEIAATAIIIQRRVGGNLSEILSNVADTMRDRRMLKRELKAMTARQILMGNVAAALPVLVALFFILLNPETGRLLYETGVGRFALLIGIAFEVTGLWLIRRFSRIEV